MTTIAQAFCPLSGTDACIGRTTLTNAQGVRMAEDAEQCLHAARQALINALALDGKLSGSVRLEVDRALREVRLALGERLL